MFTDEKKTNENVALEVREVPITAITMNPFQPRKEFEPEALEELAESIRSVGLIHPPVVHSKTDGTYELISGERRFRAAQLAGFSTISVLVRQSDGSKAAEAGLIENVQRVDLNPLEIAEGLHRLMSKFGHTQEELASRIGKKRSTVANYLRLLSMPQEVRDALASKKIAMGHAKAILSLEDEEQQKHLLSLTISKGWSVRQTEKGAKTLMKGSKGVWHVVPSQNIHLATIQEAMQRKLGTKVTIAGSEKRGRISIDYYNLDDLDRLMELLAIQDHML